MAANTESSDSVNHFKDETRAQRVRRLAVCACLNSGVVYRGVRHGLCYFDLYYASSEPGSGPKVPPSLPPSLPGGGYQL
jgi:hypothetical protein